MTREEAISFLQSRIDLIDKYYPQVRDYREALDVAIEALEQDALRAKIEEMAETIIKADKAGGNEVMAY